MQQIFEFPFSFWVIGFWVPNLAKNGSKLAKFRIQNPITQKLKENSKIPTITFKNVYQRSFIPNFSLLALIVFPEKITTLFWDTGVLVKNGPKNGKMVIFWDFLSSKWLKLYIHLQQHQLQVSSKFEVFSMSSFYFMELKPPYFGHFWARKRLKLTRGNRDISKTTWNFD